MLRGWITIIVFPFSSTLNMFHTRLFQPFGDLREIFGNARCALRVAGCGAIEDVERCVARVEGDFDLPRTFEIPIMVEAIAGDVLELCAF
jgi:hypothetical protein